MERSEADTGLQLICPSKLKSALKASATMSWVCVCVCVCEYVCPWAHLTSRKLLSALFAVYTCIYCIRYSSALLCSRAPHYYCINKPQLLNVSARFVFLALARHDACLRISVGNLFIWSGPTLVIPLGYAGSESAIATRFGQTRPRVNFPGSRTTWVLR